MNRMFRPLILAAAMFASGLSGMDVRADGVGYSAAPVPHFPAADYLVGYWRNDSPIPVEGAGPGEVEIEMTTLFDANGNLYGQGTMRFPPAPGYEHVERTRYQLLSQGTWTARPGAGSGNFRLHGSGTIRTNSPDTDFSVTEDWRVALDIRIVDANTYVDSDGVRWTRLGLAQSH